MLKKWSTVNWVSQSADPNASTADQWQRRHIKQEPRLCEVNRKASADNRESKNSERHRLQSIFHKMSYDDFFLYFMHCI